MLNIENIVTPLFVPANRPERFGKAAVSGADSIILDLEDAVAGDAKEYARKALTCDFTDLPVIVRINSEGSSWHIEDLQAVRQLPVAAVMLPKAENSQQIRSVFEALGKRIPIIALIETALGVSNARSIAATQGVKRIAFGSVDFCADLGCAHLREVLLPRRSELIMASRLAGIAAPIDGVTTALDDLNICFEDSVHAKNLGFTGKLCIHPKQVGEVKRAFLPSKAEIIWAEKIVLSGDGAISVDGEMVDEPVRIHARAILARAKKSGI